MQLILLSSLATLALAQYSASPSPSPSQQAPLAAGSSSSSVPGYLPDYQGDRYTDPGRIAETKALNAPFFQSIGGAPSPPPLTPSMQGVGAGAGTGMNSQQQLSGTLLPTPPPSTTTLSSIINAPGRRFADPTVPPPSPNTVPPPPPVNTATPPPPAPARCDCSCPGGLIVPVSTTPGPATTTGASPSTLPLVFTTGTPVNTAAGTTTASAAPMTTTIAGGTSPVPSSTIPRPL